jgi:hypothetical protein
MADKIKMRRGELPDLPTLDDGEFGLAKDVNSLYIGNEDSGNILINPVKERVDGYSLDGYLYPAEDNTHGLGSTSLRWRNIVVGPGSLHMRALPGEVAASGGFDWTLSISANGSLDISQNGLNGLSVNPDGSGVVLPGALHMNDGTESAPAYSFISDSDTGVYLSASNELSISTAGTQRFVVNSDGDVGIGTDSISNNLHIREDQNADTGVLVENDTAGASALSAVYCKADTAQLNLAAYSSAAAGTLAGEALADSVVINTNFDAEKLLIGIRWVKPIHFYTNNTIAMTIDSTQRVGIGTTSPSKDLDVNGNVKFNGEFWSAGSGGNAAFVAGPSASASGTNPIAIGQSASVGAGSSQSIAIGSSSTVSSGASIAIGNLTTVGNDNATSVGSESSATGLYSIALGYKCISNSENSIAIGRQAGAGGDGAISIGEFASGGADCVTIGAGNPSSSGIGTVIVGWDHSIGSNSNYALSIGYGSTIQWDAPNCVAIGRSVGILADAEGAVAIGYNADVAGTAPFGIAIGQTANIDGENAIALGWQAKCNGDQSIAIGVAAEVRAVDNESIAIGHDATTTASNQMMVGDSVATLDLVVPFGSVGIGTDSPSNPLHVYGIVDTPFEVKIENQGTLVNANVGVKLVTNTSGATWTADQDEVFLIADGDDTGTLAFRTQTSSSYQTRMKIGNTGDVGIGQDPVTGSKLSLPQEDFAGTPTLSFGDGDSGFYESADDILRISIAGTDRFAINTNSIFGATSGSAAIIDEAASATNPTLVPNNQNFNTGIGQNTTNELSLITSATEALRIDSNQDIGIGQAPVTGSQLSLPSENDAVTPTLSFGDGDTGLYESSDDVLTMSTAGAARLSISAVGGVGIGKAPVTGSKLNLPLENDAVTPTISFGDGDTGFYESTDDTIKIAIAGSDTWSITSAQISGSTVGSGAILDEAASSTNPTVVPSDADFDTGLGLADLDELSLIAGGVEGLRVAPDGYVNVKNNLYVDSRIILHKHSGDPVAQSGHNKIYADGYNVRQVNQNSAIHTLSGSGVHTHRHNSTPLNLDGTHRYYFPNQVSGHSVNSSSNTTQDRMYMVPFVTGEVIREIDQVAVYVSSTSTSVFVLGIYDSVSDTNLRPYRLIYNSTQHSAGTTGTKFEDVSIRLEPGKVYWTCFHGDTDVTNLQVPHYYTVQTSAITGYPSTGTYQTGFYIGRTYNSTLPEHFGPATLIGVTTYVPQAMFRYSGY